MLLFNFASLNTEEDHIVWILFNVTH